MTVSAPNIRSEQVDLREVTELIIVFQEEQVEQTETGEAVTHNNLQAEVRTTLPTVEFAIIAARGAISRSTVPNGAVSVGDQAILANN